VLASLNSAREKARIAAGQLFDASMYHAYGANAVGIWDFNEGTGGSGTIITDTSGNGFDGIISGNPTWVTGVNGVSGTALHFDGSTNGIVLPPSLASRIDLLGGTNGALMLTAWIRQTSVNPTNTLVCGLPGFMFSSYWIYKLRTYVSGGSVTVVPISNATIPNNKWTHVAFLLRAGKDFTYYIDGKSDLVLQNPSLIIATPTDIMNLTGFTFSSQIPVIGGPCITGKAGFVGDIANVRLYYADF
jgi:hypothetical protein